MFEWAASRIADEICARKKLAHRPKAADPITTKQLVSFLGKAGVMANPFAVAREIEAVDDLRAVRHCIAHCDGDPSRLRSKEDQQRVETLIASGIGISHIGNSPLIDPDESWRVWVEECYCFKAHSDVFAFLKKVMTAAKCFS